MQSRIRQATTDDQEAIWRFLDDAYGTGSKGRARFKYPDRWIWQFLDNPFVKKDDTKLPIWLAIKGDEIVGQICALPVQMKIRDDLYDGCWACDLIVSRNSRGEGLSYKLTESLTHHYQVCIGVGMADSTRHIWGKMEPVPLKTVQYYWRPIHLDRPILRYFIGDKFKSMHGVLTMMANIVLSAKTKFLPQQNTGTRPSIREINEFGEEFDDLMQKSIENYSPIALRSSKFLNWRFANNKEHRYHAFVSLKDDRIKGYIVVRNPHSAEVTVGQIVDFLAIHNDATTLSELLDHAIEFFGRSVAAIKCATSVVNIGSLLKKRGFLKLDELRPLALVLDPEIKKRLQSTSEGWYFTLADQDLDQIVFNIAERPSGQ
jgi:hypothetical protein